VPTSAEPLLEVNELVAGYGAVSVLRGASFTVNKGELLLVAGRNGAGKTTLLKCLMGIHKTQSGSISFEGEALERRPSYVRARRSICWVPEGRGIIPELSVEDNLDLGAFSSEWDSSLRPRTFERFPILHRALHRSAGSLSGGEQQMLALARVFESRPKLIILDEPSLGLAPSVVDHVVDILSDMKDEGHSLLVVEQRTAQIGSFATRSMLLRDGVLESVSADDASAVDFAEYAS
jgi:branched-chain amino acid transport system ATP-binding protein